MEHVLNSLLSKSNMVIVISVYYYKDDKHVEKTITIGTIGTLAGKTPAECYFPREYFENPFAISSLGDVVTQLG